MTEIKTLAMLKMEKNFRGHIEKGYPRFPYRIYNMLFWIERLTQELNELKEKFALLDFEGMREELADLSNLVDYDFERSLLEEQGFIKDLFIDDDGKKGKKQLYEHNKKLR